MIRKLLTYLGALSNMGSEILAPEEVWKFINDENALVLDVRSAKEQADGILPRAVCIPHTELGERVSEIGDDKERPIVIYCAKGGRAGKAQTLLSELGYSRVYNGGGYLQLVG